MSLGGFGWNKKEDPSLKEELKQLPKFAGIFAGMFGVIHLMNKGWNWAEIALAAGGGAVGAGAVGVAGAASYVAAHNTLYKKRAVQEMRYVRIVPHANTLTKKEGVAHLIKAFWRSQRPKMQRLQRGREWFQILFCCEDGEHEQGDISIYIGFPQDRWSYLLKTIKSIYPTAEVVKDVTKPQIPVFAQASEEGKGRILTWRAKNQAGFPLQAFKGEDKISKVLEHLEPGNTIALTFSPTGFPKLKKNTKKARKHLYDQFGFDQKKMPMTHLDADAQDEIKQLRYRERSNQNPFEVSIALYDNEGRDYAIQAMTNAINSVVATQNSLHKTLVQFKSNPIQYAPQHLPLPNKINPLMVWTGNELSSLLHLPNGKSREEQRDNRPHIYDRIPHIMHGQSLLSEKEFTHGVKIGEYINPAQGNRSVYINPEQLRFHGVLLGKTGSGKTATALEMTSHLLDLSVLQKTGGFTVIDPKATFVKNMLTRINKRILEGVVSKEHLEKIHYFDITSKEYSFGLNPLERPNGKPPTRTEAEAIIDRTLDVFKAAWAAESILFERFGRLILKTLLADPDEQHTILALPEFLREESPLRDRLIQKLKQGDSYAKEIARDLEEEVAKGNFTNQKTDALVNRLSRIKESATLRRIFGQKKTTIKPLEWMNKGHIVLFNTEGVSDDQMTILMGYILYEYHRQCRNRNNPNQNHYMVIDEAHNVKGLDVLHKKVIPEDREFGLSLFLMTQMLHQFPAPFFDALTEVAGTYMSCEVGAENARILEKITQGRISAATVQGLQTLRTVVDATDSKGQRLSFITKSSPPIIYHKDGSPTYYGEDGERTSKEKAKALDDCLEAVGKPLMQRDCLPVHQIEQDIDEYIASLVGEEETETSSEELVKKAQTPKSSLTKKFVSSKKKTPVRQGSKRLIITKKKPTGGDNT